MRLIALSCLLTFIVAPAAHAQTKSDFLRTNPKFIDAFRNVVKPHAAATVRIRCDGKDTCLGTAIDADGWILTKAHDLSGMITCKFADGKTLPARLVGVHELHDLAMLKVNQRLLNVASFASSKDTSAGSWVACVGTTNEPAAIGVVGVATRTVKEAYLGIQLDSTPKGLEVQGILKNSAAWKAGLFTKDILISVNGKNIADVDHLQQLLGDFVPGDTVSFLIRRDKKEQELRVTLQSREQAGDFRSEFQNRLGSDLSTRRSGYRVILQHDAVLKPSDCGGPLVDLKGRVIGVNISRAGRVETWAIPGEVITPLLADLRSGRLAPKMKE